MLKAQIAAEKKRHNFRQRFNAFSSRITSTFAKFKQNALEICNAVAQKIRSEDNGESDTDQIRPTRDLSRDFREESAPSPDQPKKPGPRI